jgi:predicted translin family RNA/ssDNA-binding protein
MRSELNQSAEAFNDFRGQMIQMVREGTELTIKRQDEAIQAQIHALAEGTRQVVKAMADDLLAPIEKGAASLARATTDLAEHTRGLASAADLSTVDVKQSFGGLVKAVDAAARRAAGAADSSGEIIGQAIQRATSLSEQTREEQLRLTRELAERMVEFREYLGLVGGELRKIPSSIRDAVDETLDAGRSLVAENSRQAEALGQLPATLAEALQGGLGRLNSTVEKLATNVNAALTSDATRQEQAAQRALLDKLSTSIDSLGLHIQSRDDDRGRGWSLFGRSAS